MTSNSLVPKPFDVRDARRAREEAARLAERRDGATWQGVGTVAVAVQDETVAREELAAVTEAEAAAIRQQVVDEALAAAEKFIDVDAKLADIDEAYGGVITEAGQLGTRLSTAEQDLTAAQGRLTDAESDLVDAFGQISTVDGKAGDAAAAASTAQGKADTAKTAADQAAADALAAAGLAGTKGKTLIQPTAPGAADRNNVTLWIDTTAGANTPKRWVSGTTWAAVTDKVAMDAGSTAASAAAAAAAAQSTANAAQTAAGTAGTNATAALTMAGSKSKVYYSTAVATGTGTAAGDLWRQRNESNEVIAEWQWSGSSWVKQTVSGSNVSNMDIGFLTAGAATMSQALIDKLVAGTASFQTVDVKNLFVTTGTMAEAVITKLWADVVMSRKVTAEMLAVGSFDNLIAEPDFANEGVGWQLSAGKTIVAGAGRLSGAALRLVKSGAGATSIYAVPVETPIEGGNAYRLVAWVKPSVSAPAGSLTVVARTKTGAGVNAYPAGRGVNTTAVAAGQWARITGAITTAGTAVSVAFFLEMTGAYPAGATADWDMVSVTRMNAGELTVDGTVTARALESELVLTTKVVAGDPTATHAEMSPLGFKVFASPAGGGTPTEVVRLGVAATDDYFSVTRADGSLAATISQDGKVSATQVNANGSLWYKGEEMQALLDKMPRGIISAAYRDTNSNVNAAPGADIPYLRLEADLLPGRIYKVWTSPMTISLTGGTVLVTLKHNQGALATMSSPQLTQAFMEDNANAPVLQELYAVSAPTRASFLLGMGVLGGQSGFAPSQNNPVRLVVEDIGPASNQIGNGTSLNGTTPPPPAVNSYVKQYGSIGSMNYQGNNNQYNYDTGHMYQGLSPAGMGNTKSISIHPSMTADLSGATINYIRVYFTFNHWYYNAGGTARIGLHGHASIPSSFSGSGIAATSYGWPRPGARWVDLPSSVFAGFKSGAYKGIYLEGDGSYGTYGIADRPTLEIGYTK